MKQRALILTLAALLSSPAISSAQATGKGGGNTKATVTNVSGISVTPRTGAGPLVRWDAIDKATFQVQRSKADDMNCCNASSPAGLTGTSWEDAALPAFGFYVYRVTATLRGGQTVSGAYQFNNPAPAQPSPLIAGDPTAVTNIVVVARDSIGLGPIVRWDQIPNATFQVERFNAGDINCCNNASPQALTGFSWEDSRLPASGVYVYRVIATLRPGVTVSGATQFPYTLPAR